MRYIVGDLVNKKSLKNWALFVFFLCFALYRFKSDSKSHHVEWDNEGLVIKSLKEIIKGNYAFSLDSVNPVQGYSKISENIETQFGKLAGFRIQEFGKESEKYRFKADIYPQDVDRNLEALIFVTDVPKRSYIDSIHIEGRDSSWKVSAKIRIYPHSKKIKSCFGVPSCSTFSDDH